MTKKAKTTRRRTATHQIKQSNKRNWQEEQVPSVTKRRKFQHQEEAQEPDQEQAQLSVDLATPTKAQSEMDRFSKTRKKKSEQGNQQSGSANAPASSDANTTRNSRKRGGSKGEAKGDVKGKGKQEQKQQSSSSSSSSSSSAGGGGAGAEVEAPAPTTETLKYVNGNSVPIDMTEKLSTGNLQAKWIVDEEDATDIFGILQSLRIRTFQALYNWAESESKEVIAAKQGKGSYAGQEIGEGPAANIMAFVEAYNRGQEIGEHSKESLGKRGVEGGTGAPRKLQRPKRFASQPIVELLFRSTTTKVEDSDDDHPTYITKLNDDAKFTILGINSTGHVMFVRECFPRLKTTIESTFEDTTLLFLSGTPGTGKTVFGAWIVLQMIEEGKAVIYHYKKRPPVLFCKDREKLKGLYGDIDVTLTDDDIDEVNVTIDGSSVYAVALEKWESYTAIMGCCKDLWVVFDLEEKSDFPSPDSAKCKVLVLTSNEKKWPSMHKQPYVLLYMPLWSEKELVTAANNGANVNGVPTREMVSSSDLENTTTIEGLHRLYGGSARYVLMKHPSQSAKEIDYLCGEPAKMVKALNPYCMDEEVSGRFVHVPVDSFTFQPLHQKGMASAHLARRAYVAFTEMELYNMANEVRRLVGQIGLEGVAGTFAEAFWHRYLLASDSESVPMLYLGKHGSQEASREGTKEKWEMPRLNGPFFFTSYDEIDHRPTSTTSSFENAYYRSSKSNHGTIDSFTVVRRSSLPKTLFSAGNADDWFIVGFQMTVTGASGSRPQHPFDPNNLKKLQDKVHALLGGKGPPPEVILCFVIPTSTQERFNKQSPSSKDNITIAGETHQVALVMPDPPVRTTTEGAQAQASSSSASSSS